MDWLLIFFRWLALFAITIAFGTQGILRAAPRTSAVPFLIAALALPALFNIAALGFLSFNRRPPHFYEINVLLDGLFALILLITAGEPAIHIPWIGLLPVFSAALCYGLQTSLIIAMGIAFLQSLILFLTTYSFNGPSIAAVWGALLGASGVLTLLRALVSRRLNRMAQAKSLGEEQTSRRQDQERLRALFKMIETFSSTLNYRTVLEAVLDTAFAAMDQGNAATSGSMIGCVLLFGNQQTLQMQYSRGFVARDASIELEAKQGALAKVIRSGETQQTLDPGKDPELGALVSLHNTQAALCLPLIRGMNAYGIILFAHPDAKFFHTERVETLQMLANQAVIALQNARLYQDLTLEKERILQAQEEVQKKLARDLHDGPTQSISAIAMRVNIARKLLHRSADSDPSGTASATQEAEEELIRIEELARQTTEEIRHMLFTLRPLILESEGLEATLQAMAGKMRDIYGQNVTLKTDPQTLQRLNAAQQAAVFYLTEEAVNNARKHAQAAEVQIRLEPQPGNQSVALLEIADNGVGFDVDAVLNAYERRGSLGMLNLRERTEQIDGLLKIDSAPGKGTRIQVLIPFDSAAADLLHPPGSAHE